MSTMQDWANDLANGISQVARNHESSIWSDFTEKSETWPNYDFSVKTWPFSGFFDWFDNDNKGAGYLPAFMAKVIVPSSAGAGGINGNFYNVNRRYLFIGLNPNYKNQKNETEKYVNDGTFMGFNLDASSIAYNLSIGNDITDLMKLCALFYQDPQYKAVYNHFKGSYMMDIAPLVNSGRSGEAKKTIEDNWSICEQILYKELDAYKEYVYPNSCNSCTAETTPSGFSGLTICAFGEKAYKFLELFRYGRTADWDIRGQGLGRGLFPGAQVYQLRHYSHGGAVKTLQQLINLFKQANQNTRIPTELFPPLEANKKQWDDALFIQNK
jgi:hypothetical protein